MHEMLAKLLHRLLLEALDNRDDFPRILLREALQLTEPIPVLDSPTGTTDRLSIVGA